MRDPKKEKKSKKEIRRMLRSLASKDHVDGFFSVGRFQARKVLADGTIVTFSVQEPGHRARPKTLPTPRREVKKTSHSPTAN